MKWYKRDPDAAMCGMLGLTMEERGAYNTILDLLYSRDGDVPNDDVFLARAQQCRPQMWRRVRDSLIAKGKIRITDDGKLDANRVQTELKTARKLIAKMSELGVVSAEKRKQNKGATPTGPLVTTTTTTTTREDKKEEDTANAVLSMAYFFESGVIRLSEKDFRKWEDAFPYLSLKAELLSLTEWAGQQAKWYHAVSAALAKKNRNQKLASEQSRAAGRVGAREGIL